MANAVIGKQKREAPARARATPGALEVGYPDVVRAFNAVSEAINEETELEPLLHLVAEKICSLVGVRRCSVYLKDERTGLFRGRVAESDRNIDAAIKGLTAGIEADGFTREILQTKQPVLIVNAKSDPRPVRSAILEWEVQTMLGVPMILRGEVIGLLFLDNQDDPHDFSAEEQELCGAFANLCATAISQAQLTSKLRANLCTVERQNSMLRAAVNIEDRLATLVLEGADLREITSAVADLTSKPALVLDSQLHLLATADTDEGGARVLHSLCDSLRDNAKLRTAFGDVTGRRPELLDPRTFDPHCECRLLVTAVGAGDATWGYLVVAEHGCWFNAHDRVVTRRAGIVIALDMSAERRAAEAEESAKDALLRDLLHGSDEPASIARRAAYHGASLTEPRIVCLIKSGTPERRGLGSSKIRKALEGTAGEGRCMTAVLEEGIVAVVEAEGSGHRARSIGAKRLIERVLGELGIDGSTSVGISGVCVDPGDYPTALREAQQILRTVDQYREDSEIRVLTADDLGAARLLLASTRREDAEKFADDTVGNLLADPELADLLATLQTFFGCSRSVRRSARELAVHENTIRYRLAQVEKLTGLGVASDAEDQLTIQMALLILRLGGKLPGRVGS